MGVCWGVVGGMGYVGGAEGGGGICLGGQDGKAKP